MIRGGFRGRGRGRGRSFGGRRGRWSPQVAPVDPAADQAADQPPQKALPNFVKVKSLRPGPRSFDLLVQVSEVRLDCSRTEKRRGRPVTTKCIEALVGDDTGCILLVTRQQDKVDILKEGEKVVLLNVRMRRAQDDFWVEVDNWGAIKSLDTSKDLVPENFDAGFQINKSEDRSRRLPQKPKFSNISDLEPEQRGISIVAKVTSVKKDERPRADGSPSTQVEATVGDLSASILLIARGQHVETVKEGAVVAIFNARIVMYGGHMRLVVDRWSSVKTIDAVEKSLLPETHISSDATPNANNRSTIEWELQRD